MVVFTLNGLRTRYHQLAQGDDVQRTRGVVQKVQELLLQFRLSGAKTKGGFVGICLFIMLYVSWSVTSLIGATPVVESKNEPPITQRTRYLHLLVTSPAKSLPSCRLLVSAASNNFPAPILTSWKHNDPSPQTPIEKIQGVVDFLKSLDARHDNDVIIIPDVEGSIFQLRPDVLVERYIELTRLHQERISTDIGPGVTEKEGIHQRVIFAAQKTCAGHEDDAACYAIPESPLSTKIYGPTTDRDTGYARERYLSSGFMMGDMTAVRRLYEDVLITMETKGSTATEQDIISKFFGEQEYNREALRKTYALPTSGTRDRNRVMDTHPTHKKVDLEGGTGLLDYGISLDYEGILGSAKMGSKFMGVVVHNSSQEVSLPEDIEQRSLRPWWSRNPSTDGFPSELGWKDSNLLTNLWSGVIPGALYIPDAKSEEGQKAARETWERLWFQKYVRMKMDDYVTQPDRPFTRTRGNGEETRWWGLKREKFRLRWAKNWPEGTEVIDWLDWKDMCEGFQDEVFADGLGVWESKYVEFGQLRTDHW